MAEIADSLKRLAPPAEAPAARPSALRSSPKYAAKSPKDQSTPLASRVEGMDLEVLRSAREAGVPDSQISQMLELASKGKPQLTDVPPPRKKVSILSDARTRTKRSSKRQQTLRLREERAKCWCRRFQSSPR